MSDFEIYSKQVEPNKEGDYTIFLLCGENPENTYSVVFRLTLSSQRYSSILKDIEEEPFKTAIKKVVFNKDKSLLSDISRKYAREAKRLLRVVDKSCVVTLPLNKEDGTYPVLLKLTVEQDKDLSKHVLQIQVNVKSLEECSKILELVEREEVRDYLYHLIEKDYSSSEGLKEFLKNNV